MNLLQNFVSVSSDHGELTASWAPSNQEGKAYLVIALRPLSPADAQDFAAGRLDNDLIRLPIKAHAGFASTQVPVGRPLSVGIVIRTDDGNLVPGPTVRLEAAPLAGDHLEAPVSHEESGGHDTPFIFAGPGPHPSISALAERISKQTTSGSSMPPLPPAQGGCFGTRQRWYLTRLHWQTPESGLVAIISRDHAFDDHAIASWVTAPPQDARIVDTPCDGLIDGLTPEGAFRYFAVLSGPAPWKPLAIMPSLPPFVDAQAPLIMGDAAGRLEHAISEHLRRIECEQICLADLPPLFSLIEASTSALLQGHPPLQRIMTQVDQVRNKPRI